MTVRRFLAVLPLVVLLLVSVAWYWLLHTEAGTRWIWTRVENATGGALSASEITGSIRTALQARDIHYAGDGVDVRINRVSLAVDIDLMPLRVTVLPARVADLVIELSADKQPSEQTDLGETFAKLQLPVELVFTEVRLERGAIHGIGEGSSIVVDTLALTGRWADDWQIERFSIVSADLQADGRGSFSLGVGNELFLETDLLLAGDMLGLDEPVAAEVTIQGPLNDLVTQGKLDEPRTIWHGRLTGITDKPTWELRLNMPAFELPSGPELPAVPPVELTADATGNFESLSFDALTRFAGTNMQVRATAQVDVDAATVTGSLEWAEAHWPIGHPEPRVRSQTGQVTLSGSLDDWRVAGTIDLAVPDLPPGALTIESSGDRIGADIRILDGSVFGGSVSGRARYTWNEPQTYSAALALSAIDTSTVFPEWAAKLGGRLDLEGRQSPFELAASITEVRGEFRGRRVEADGRLNIRENSVAFDDLRVIHGKTNIRIDGELYAAEGLNYDLAISELGQYLADARGGLVASGSVSLRPGSEYLRLNASSEELAWRDLALSNLDVVDQGSGTEALNTSIAVDRLTYGELDFGRLEAHSRIGRDTQRVEIDLDSGPVRTGLTVSGKLDSWDVPTAWAGVVSRLEFTHEKIGGTLEQPARIDVSKDAATIQPFCLIGERGVRLCSEGSWESLTGITFASDLSSVPVNVINAFLDTRLRFDQEASGQVTWRSNADGTSSGRGDFAMTGGTIVSIDDEDLFLETGPANLGFDLDNDSLRGGRLDIPLPGLGQIAAQFEFLDATEGGSADLDGHADIDIEDIGLLVALVPIFDSAAGVLRADLELGGTTETPLLRGDFSLEQGSLSYLPIGLRLDDIELSSELQENGEIELTGSFRAGDGLARIRTRADHARTATTGLELTLKGDNLTLIDVPDLRAVADTDLRVNFDGRTLEMNGNIAVPHARITPTNLGATAVFESEDVVIVAGELPGEPQIDVADSEIEYAGSVTVSLGADVVVDLDVTEVDVTGSTVFTWTGEPIPNALGRYDVDGEVLIFGQRLDITEGSVRFDDDPADDPYLRVRAEREIFGNTQVRRAGVLIAGSLSRPTIEPYTLPATTEERALTLLVTGSDFDYERGVGAVGFGTYIAPRVYVSYGIGLFDNENVIRIRYDLKRGFGITGSSGGRESGVDLSYQFEN